MVRNPTVLVFMSPARRALALERLDACRAQVLLAGDLTQACSLLKRQVVDVVITDGDPGASWRTLMEFLEREGIRASVVVSTEGVDPRLCADVFNRGAYDLLVEPYSREELLRVLEGAASRAYMRRLQVLPATG